MARKSSLDTSNLSADLFKTSALADKERAEFREEVVRSEAQTVLDNQVKALYAKWSEKGKPEFTRSDLNKANSGIPRNVTHFAPENAEVIHKMLTLAGNYNHATVVISPLKAHTDGSVMYYWAVRDPKERDVQRVTCPVCDALVALRADGKRRTHGPRDARCPGGAPPKNANGDSADDDEFEGEEG